MLAVAGGLSSPTSGQVQIGDEQLVGRSAKELSRLRRELIGFVFQSSNLVPALMVRPQVLLVDEPTAALDRQRSQEVVEVLARETKEQGVATVMVTHDRDVLTHCDSVYEMVDGRLTRQS
ncbi:hypothetical protein GCM10007231_21410 [Nocardioides daphniae]|uniref:ATP-binding cassette domain-containing protein n=1 Tax=Nocardioides daphniae TaxID=402297 RepID=A0ABQ1QBC8_9ACTN|nr:hypothetical protein GCM10007231_21410 [Nocardioides daphniae]